MKHEFRMRLRIWETLMIQMVHPAMNPLHLQRVLYVFDLLAWWCKLKETFASITKLVKLTRANPALSAAA